MLAITRTAAAAALALAALVVLAAPAARADARRFAWTYESGTMPRGVAEYEQWVTWKTDRDSDSEYDRLEFRQEIEYDLTDRLQVALYLADWRYTRATGGSDTELLDTALEVIWNLSDPVRTALGVALYGEVKLDSELFELEGKLLLEKQVAGWIVAYNAVIESEWEGEDWAEDNGAFKQLLAVSYAATPRVSLGAEALHEVGVEDWSDAGDALFYAGPNAHFLLGRGWWVTTTPLLQLSNQDEEPNLQWRTLVGVTF